MSAALHARGLSLALGARHLLTDVDLSVDPGQRIGLVGPNGVGKSTLLRVIAGLLPPDRGSVQLAPSSANVGYLPQEPERLDETVVEYLGRHTGVADANFALHDATDALAAGSLGADDDYSDALDRWLALGAADFDARVGEVWADLGLGADLLEQGMPSLSGGEAARAGLAALLLARFDVFLLDEPTNDLDLDGLARLERFVNELSAGCVIVSHDRTFLQRTVTHVVELDEFTHTATRFSGGWDAFLREREVARQQARQAYEEYDAKRSSLAGRSQREREWATQGLSKAKKKPDDNDKNIKSFKINQSEQLAGKAARTEKMMERLEVVEEPREAWQLRLVIKSAPRSGNVVARLDHAVVEQGGFALGPIDLQIDFGEKVVIEGPNGAGKSTLLKALLGETPLTSGTHWRGPGVVVGRLEQAREQLQDADSVLEAFMAATGMLVPEARTLLAKFGIGAEHVHRGAESLSPGERTRLVLALLMAKGSNCLVLDEPTNHLDLPAIEQLEQALTTFDGTVLLVSHDRSLLGNVARTRTLRLDAGRIVADIPS
ncbi:MAG: ABC-F family ATP-binding cassette domain-containing protein [Actinobacteria bacterium]|nr:ABC-F family ATP-binding cassette domain-containing protein [Actinomycetota bacterium]